MNMNRSAVQGSIKSLDECRLLSLCCFLFKSILCFGFQSLQWRVCVVLPWQGPGLQGLCDSGFSPVHWSPMRHVTRRRATPSPQDTEHWEIRKKLVRRENYMASNMKHCVLNKHKAICLSRTQSQSDRRYLMQFLQRFVQLWGAEL